MIYISLYDRQAVPFAIRDVTGDGRPEIIVTSLSGGGFTKNIKLNRVNGTGRGTTFGFTPSGGGTVQLFLYTYFPVTATVIGGIGNPIFCHNGTYISGDRFVALPASNVCDASVVVRNASAPATVALSTVKDRGPWFPHGSPTSGNPCAGPDDPYWNTGGVPRAATDPCSSNGAGIDLSNGTAPDVAITGSGQVFWRFN